MGEWSNAKLMPFMACGCRANSMGKKAGDKERRPACVIHSCFEVAQVQPSLEGREAKCTMCGEIKPSTDPLAFFKYKGPGSYSAAIYCKHCMYTLHAHKKKDMGHEFEAHGPYDYDEFYCGCKGWD